MMPLRSFIMAAAFIMVGAIASASCGTADEEPATFTRVQSEVFAVSCVFSACHKGASPAGEMSLETDAFDDIVNVPSSQVPEKLRVKPGDPEGSYLMDKLLNRQTVGTQMPQGGMLEEERIDLVRRWITLGALDD